MLFPSQLPDQLAQRVRPGRFVDGGAMTFPLVVTPGSRRRILWDLDRYICAYPEAVVSGGKGGKMTWKWAESLRGASIHPGIKGRHFKGRRNEWKDKTFTGFGDRLVFDGRARAVFRPLWFRCGRWCELVIEAGAEPVEILDLALIETRYPLACETTFSSPGDPALAGVQAICTRAMQMCCHEMLFDCPFYEQQMYPGDTRVQLNVISAMTADDAIIRRAGDLSGDYLCDVCCEYNIIKAPYRREWFESSATLPFEGMTIAVPAGYDAVLRHRYGDYRQLPPEEQRVTHHDNRCYLRDGAYIPIKEGQTK
jgi:hypothetical protein